MIDTNERARRYDGNGSTTLPYPITFPFLEDAANIQVRIVPPTGSPFNLTTGQFTVHDAEGPNPYVTTATAYGDTYEVIPFRWVAFTQPFEFPNGSALNSVNIERAIDRAIMIAMQTGDMALDDADPTITAPPEGLRDVPTWADAAARASVTPQRVGQLGVQRSDASIWISTATSVGAWEQFRPLTAAPPEMADKLTFMVIADTGVPGAMQDAVTFRAGSAVGGWNVDGVMVTGDNRYDPATFSQAWASFSSLIAAEKVWPALGNHDYLDWTAHAAKFPYLPRERYYSKVFGDGLFGLITLHSGYNHAGVNIEPDGNTVGSVQHTWFVQQLEAMEAAGVRWIIVQMHHPMSTLSSEATRAFQDLNWPEFSRVHGVFCGHVHLWEWLIVGGVPVINTSGGIQSDGDVSETVSVVGIDATPLWADDRNPLIGRLTITPTRFLVQWCDLWTGRVRYERALEDTTVHRHSWTLELIEPTSPVPIAVLYGGLSGSIVRNPEFFLAVKSTAGSSLAGTVLVDGVVAASWSIAAGNYFTVANSSVHIRRGAQIAVEVVTNAAYPAWEGLQLTINGNLIG